MRIGGSREIVSFFEAFRCVLQRGQNLQTARMGVSVASGLREEGKTDQASSFSRISSLTNAEIH